MEEVFKSELVRKDSQTFLQSVAPDRRRLSERKTVSKKKEIDDGANLEHVDTILAL